MMCSYEEGFPEGIIEEWLRFHQLDVISNYKVGKGMIGLTYYLPKINLGIIVAKWKRPLTISIIHKAIRVYEWLGLDSLIIVTNRVSYVASENLERSTENIQIVTIDSLSDLAMILSSKTTTKVEATI